MDILLFNKIFNDKNFFNLKKLGYKYKNDIVEFIEILKDLYYKEILLKDFAGDNLVYIDSFAKINLQAYKTLLYPQEKPYGEKALENEIISTAQIENIDYNRDSVRNILKGLAPKDDEENRIYGLKKGFEFISDRSNKITLENIYKLYMLSVGSYLSNENALKNNNYYRHDSVYIVGQSIEHSGMDYKRLDSAMADLVKFINTKGNINDLAKSSIIHFYIAYIHPYFDGNGRMARMLHLWYLIQQGYDTALFIPFSSLIAKSRKEYYNAYSNIEENYKVSGVVDISPFINYFEKFIYSKLQYDSIMPDSFSLYKENLKAGKITEKEKQLWSYVVSKYGKAEFSTLQLEKDFSNVAYATVRAFVLKFEKLGLLTSQKYKNRVKYKIK